jgi:hypothetical protein
MNVNERVGVIKKRLQDATATHKRVGVDAYEAQGRDIYGHLREAWERAVTEVLLNDVVQRYRHSIETKKVRSLPDITDGDCDAVESAMTECSRWMRGHDAPAADTTPFPAPAELARRVQELEDWLKRIRARRAKKK